MLRKRKNRLLHKSMSITIVLGTIVMLLLFPSCGGKKKITGDAITERDSMAVMQTSGVTTLISDSGVTRYRVNTEEWLVFDRKKPSYWAFEKGVYLEQFDSIFHIEASIKADTAYYYDKERLWKLIGNVDIQNRKGERFNTELLYWNEATQKVYSDKFIRIQQPDRIITGHGFDSNQQMTVYTIHNIEGIFYVDDEATAPPQPETKALPDSVKKDSVKYAMNIYISLIITMLFSAFFSGMEIAFVSVDKLRFEMERKGGITSRILSIFFKNPNEFISTMLVGNNIALVIYGILMAQIIGENLLAGFIDNHFLMVLAQTVISTLIILVTGEFLPKTLFKINPNMVLNVFAVPLFICYVVLYPISKLSSGLSCIFLRIFGMKVNKDASDKAFGKVDLDYFVQSSIDNAENEEELDTEVKIFQNALDFSNIKIRDCIVPRTEVVAVDLTTSLDELKSRFIESGISKIIVYDGNIDNVVGYIHSSEMFRAPTNWHENVKQVPIVPETMSANKLMKLFMQQKKTIAVVVDEFGGTSGIVSLEDLVEEIFGDIEDEHDNTSYISKQIDEHEYVLSGRLEIEKVNETFGLDLPESDEYLTVGGLILNQYQSFPKLHEVIRVGRYQFKIIKVTATKIELVRLKVME